MIMLCSLCPLRSSLWPLRTPLGFWRRIHPHRRPRWGTCPSWPTSLSLPPLSLPPRTCNTQRKLQTQYFDLVLHIQITESNKNVFIGCVIPLTGLGQLHATYEKPLPMPEAVSMISNLNWILGRAVDWVIDGYVWLWNCPRAGLEQNPNPSQ